MAPRPSPQTERVVNLFEQLMGGSQGMTLAEVSRHLNVHKASCHSMLSELLRAGWLLRDPVRKTYHLGPALVRLGREAAGRYPALVLARSVMAELSAETRAALEAGLERPVDAPLADEFVSRVGAFLHDVEDSISAAARMRPIMGRVADGSA